MVICVYPDPKIVFIFRMQSLDDPLWPEEDVAATEPQYYNSIPNKMPPPGGIIDERLRAQHPNQGDNSQV